MIGTKQISLAAIASLAPPGANGFDESAQLTRPPLNFTSAGLAILALKLTQVLATRGGTPVSVAEIRSARTVGRCIAIVGQHLSA